MWIILLVLASVVLGDDCLEWERKYITKKIELDFMIKHHNEWKELASYVIKGLVGALPVYLTYRFRRKK